MPETRLQRILRLRHCMSAKNSVSWIAAKKGTEGATKVQGGKKEVS